MKYSGFAFDSREVGKGFLFFALKGKKVDGHDFLKEVADRGAIGAVVDENYGGPSFGLELIRVNNVTAYLQQLAKEKQSKQICCVVGVTGSAGKTTTKEFLSILLSSQWKVEKTPGNSNSQVGLPLAILNGTSDMDVLVAEMGMTEKGEIAKLVQIVPPHIALVTKVGVAHIGYFPDGQEGIAEAKAEIFSHPKTKIKILNASAKKFKAMENIDAVTFGVEEEADFVLKKGWTIVERGRETQPFSLPFEESHFCEDFIAAATVCRCMGMEWDAILSKVHALKSIGRRFEKIKREGVLFINDSYNAQLDSIEAALGNLPKAEKGGKVVVVFGEITDLGELSHKTHAYVAEKMTPLVDHLLCYGKGCMPMLDIFSSASKPAQFFDNFQQLKEAMFQLAKSGDVVLIKGSKINKLWQLLE